MTDNNLRIDVIPRDLYYHEVAYVRGLEKRIATLEAALQEIEWHDPKSPAAAAVRAALDKDAGK